MTDLSARVRKSRLVLAAFFMLIILSSPGFSQKYNFQHYDIDKGLLQSQVTSIHKDRLNQIWLTNMAGVNCFDGKQFMSFTTGNEHNSYDNYSVTADNTGLIWCGNSKGVVCFSSMGTHYHPFADKMYTRPVKQLVCDNQNNIWALAGANVFRIHNNKLELQIISAKDEMISYLTKDEFGNVYAAVFLEGIYKLHDLKWKPFAAIKEAEALGFISQFAFSPDHSGDIYMTARAGIYCWRDGIVNPIDRQLTDGIPTDINDFAIDHNLGIWIATDKGVYLLANHALKHFGAENGFINGRVLCAFVDNDNQVWLGTDGSGLYKYRPGNYLVYDKTQGLANDLAMDMVKTNTGVYFATYGDGVKQLENNKFTGVKNLPPDLYDNLRVNCLYADANQDLWIGTDMPGIWKKTKDKTYKVSSIHYPSSITEDKNHIIWVTSSFGCYYIENERTRHISGLDFQSSAIIEFGDNNMLLGTINGLFIIKDKKTVEPLPLLKGTNIVSVQRYGANILIGTTGKGLYVWNPKLNRLANITIQNGLTSNMVSSLLIVDKQLWVGTARGVSRFTITDTANLTLKSNPVSPDVYECNQNAILYYDGKVWVATTHGLLVFDARHTATASYTLHLALQKVTINSPDVKYTSVFKNGYTVPVAPELPSNKSGISLKFHTIEFGNNGNAMYQYKLEGLDKDFGAPVSNDVIQYPQLPPGNYTFKARAMLNGAVCNTISYEFTVTPTIYQRFIFRLFVSLLCLSLIFGVYRYKIYSHRRELEYINRLKQNEQELVRRQTAEDFHDDFGNKLTRINMLSEILAKNIPEHNEKERTIIRQIQQSASEMYAGTKDILWALNPDNDNMAEVLSAIESFAQNLFMSTGFTLKFNADHQGADFGSIRLPLGHSRHITLIFKELFTNILKHSKGDTVTFTAAFTSNEYVSFKVTDNGNGFDTSHVFAGNGIRNMRNRAKKLNATLSIDSEAQSGTTSTLLIPIS